MVQTPTPLAPATRALCSQAASEEVLRENAKKPAKGGLLGGFVDGLSLRS